MSGMIGRVIAQVLIVGVNVVSKAFMQALQRAQAGGAAGAAGAMRSAVSGARVPLDQARQILNVEKGAYAVADVEAQFNKYYAANDPDKGGSFYLQSKVFNAREALLEELKEAEVAAKAAKAAGGSRGSGGSDGGARPMQ